MLNFSILCIHFLLKFLIELINFSSRGKFHVYLMKINEEFVVNFLIHIVIILLSLLLSLSLLFIIGLNCINKLSSFIFIKCILKEILFKVSQSFISFFFFNNTIYFSFTRIKDDLSLLMLILLKSLLLLKFKSTSLSLFSA